MNALESYSTTNPFGKSDECAKFTIVDTSAVFTLAGVTTVGQLYTFSAWAKADAAGSITIVGERYSIGTEWKRYIVTFTANSLNLEICFNTTGVYYMYDSQLEIGNKATDWTPAVEDVEQDMEDVAHEVTASQQTNIIATCEELILSAKESIASEYVDKSTYETKMAELSVQADSINMRFESTEAIMDDISSDTLYKFEQIYKHIAFAEDGITISAGENTMRLKLDNDMIAFYKGDEMFGWWDGVDFHTGNIIVEVQERAQFGNFAFIPRSDGSLAFYKVGG